MKDILTIFENNKIVDEFLNNINNETYSYYINGSSKNHQYLLTYATYMKSGSFVVYIAPNVYKANLAYQSLCKLAGFENVNLYLTDEIISTELVAVSEEFKEERINTINSIIKNEKKIIVTHTLAALKINLPKKIIEENIIRLRKNDIIDIKNIVYKLITLGYEKVPTTQKMGEFSVRGEVIDIYPICSSSPVRINLFDDEIEKIRTFNYQTQKGTGEIKEVEILPVNEIIVDNIESVKKKILTDCTMENETVKNDLENFKNYQNLERMNKYISYLTDKNESILDYLDEKIVVIEELNGLKKAYEQINLDLENYLEQAKFPKELKVEFVYDFYRLTTSKKQIYLSEFKTSLIDIKLDQVFTFNTYDVINYDHNLKLLLSELKEKFSKFIIISIQTKEKEPLVKEILKENEIKIKEIKEINDLDKNRVNFYKLDNAIGYGVYDEVEIITEDELFPNNKKSKAKYRSVSQNSIKIESKDDLFIGDYIVHYDYGIAKYMGIETIELNNIKNDYLVLQYENMPLYVPVEKITLLEKYQGSEGAVPKLTRLGTKEWEKKKAAVNEKVESIAKDLIDLQVKREANQGYKYSVDSEFQKMFEEDFEFIETDDQIKIVKEIKKDMEKGKVIDRLICGDVGFGKTEIAMRIAFKTIFDGKQVAYLAPTTILTRQHYHTFKERFSKYGIRVELLNRLISEKRQKEILKDLKAGLVDVIIGTHRLLSTDVSFKDLGLLIIDEEQRFGVVHKEIIKRMKANINVLTLTATPIPRTLQMAVMGIRQLSLIETAPTDRHPIQTYVLEYNDAIIKEAIYRELGRGGQVFYLHNKISDIEIVYRKLKRLVPEAKICVGHGKMNKEDLEDTIQSFIDKEYDLLLCTTIIETGIDIPNSNTLIIDEADKLGLSQLYQIRGRVGRSDKIAYAYLTYKTNKVLTQIEAKRLGAIKEYTKLGSGYKIAVRDLAIRGAGDILGKEQAGYIDSIGLDMYMKMLDDSIKKIKGIKEEEKPNYNIEVSKHVATDYVDDHSIRIYIHKKISTIETNNDKKKLIEEFVDRFGRLNDELLLYIEEKYLESLFRKFKITSVLEAKYFVNIIFNEEILTKLKAEDIFIESTKISDKFEFEYKNRQLLIKVKKEPNDKNWIYLYSQLLSSLVKKLV